MTDPVQEPKPAQAEVVAAIDIGTNAVRMVIAQVLGDGGTEVLERLQRAVRLGQSTFLRGRLSGQTMRAAVAIFRDYRRILDPYNVRHIRAVATSAVREAGNAETFLDRIFMATGVDVEVIATSEESRLTVSAVCQELAAAGLLDAGDPEGTVGRDTLIADVGGGSTLLTVLEAGQIASSQSLPLGSVRLQEMLATSYEPPDRSTQMLRQHIAGTVSAVQGSLPMKRFESFVAVGGDARFAAKHVGKPTGSPHLFTVDRSALTKLIRRCGHHTTQELGDSYGLAFGEAETLTPALLVYQALLKATRAEEMLVSHVSMRDGLLLDLARQVTGQEDPALWDSVLRSASAIAEKYRADLKHAQTVADLSDRVFCDLQAEHGLAPRHRLVLRVAALLHEVGGFVSSRAHHKHSYYIIANSEVFGLTRDEVLTVAHVARYHRRSPPKPSHVEYMALPRETRMVVNKLAALLRVADALDRGHAQQARDLRCERQEEELLIRVPGAADLTLERRALATKADLFEDVYGLRVRLEEPQLPTAPERRAKPLE